jgi:Xaa-Pro aminopeptidase
MIRPVERVMRPVSDEELERRWAAVRKGMEERKIDVLLMQNNNDFMGGNVKYFTDIPAVTGYPVTVTFPREDGMSVVWQGAMGSERKLPPEGDGVWRGVTTVHGAPSYASAGYTLEYETDAVEKALQAYAGGTIGLNGLGTLPISMVDRLRRTFPKARFVDATEMVDQIKAIKSEEELGYIRECCRWQEAAMQAVFEAIKPDMRQIELAALAEYEIVRRGGEQGLYLICSYQPGSPYGHEHRHFQNQIIRKGDLFTLLIETSGPGGMWGELSRTCVLGKATDEMKDETAFILEARNQTLKLMAPGTPCRSIWDSYNEFMRRNGRPEENRLFCHGQGCDLVERPLVRFDETMMIQKGMNITCHPTYLTKRLYGNITDNYFIGEAGVVERVHTLSEQLVEIT